MKTACAHVLISIFVTSGCSPLAPQPDHSKLFILSPISSSSQINTATSTNTNPSNLILGVGPIYFPGYLRRPEVVTLASPNQVNISPEDRWAEPLDKNFERVVTENLTQILNTRKIEKYPWPRSVHVDYQIVIDVQRFDTNTNKESQLTARWIIKDGETGQDLYASESHASSPLDASDGGASRALSADVASMSRDIAAQVAQLKPEHLPTEPYNSNRTENHFLPGSVRGPSLITRM